MNLREVINRKIRKRARGVDVQADVDAVVAANVNERGSSTSVSSRQTVTSRRGRTSERRREEADVSDEELERQDGDELPEREAMSLVNANVAAPVNAAVALNVLSDDAAAVANAEQTADIDQSN